MFLALLACTAPPEDSAIDLPSAYTYAGEAVDDTPDPAVVQAELQAFFDEVRGFNGGPVIDDWYDVHRYADAACPAETITDSDANGHVVYFDGLCRAQERYWFKGPMTAYTFADNDLLAFEVFDFRPHLEKLTAAWTGQVIKGQTDIFDEVSDLDFNCSCTALRASASTNPDSLQWASYTDGPSHWVAPSADPDAWNNQGIQSNLWMWFERTQTTAWQAQIEGAVNNVGEVYGTVELELRMAGHGFGDDLACDEGTNFWVELRRSTTGTRTALDFRTTPGSCEACAPVGDTQVCVDLANALDWEGTPW